MTQPQDKMRAEFEAHWKTIRGLIKAKRELKRRETEPQAYACDSANRHWITWQAACAQQSAHSQQDALDAARWRSARTGEDHVKLVNTGGKRNPELWLDISDDQADWAADAQIAIAAQGASNV